MERQFTATLYIIKEEKTLLIHHKKFDKWVPPGGHLNPNELPMEAALREAKEETGLDIALLGQENVWIGERPTGKSLERPYMCALYNIPPHRNEPAHQHIDFIFVGTPVGGDETKNLNEIHDMKWFTVKEIEELLPHQTYEEILPTVRKILRDFGTLTPYHPKSFQK